MVNVEMTWPWACSKCGHKGLDPDPRRTGKYRGWCEVCAKSYAQELVNRLGEWTIQLDEEYEREERAGKALDEVVSDHDIDRILDPALCPLHSCPMTYVQRHPVEDGPDLEEWWCDECAKGETQGGPWWNGDATFKGG